MKQYIQYIQNAGDGATTAHFIEDWEPIGVDVLNIMQLAGMISVDENDRIHLHTCDADCDCPEGKKCVQAHKDVGVCKPIN